MARATGKSATRLHMLAVSVKNVLLSLATSELVAQDWMRVLTETVN